MSSMDNDGESVSFRQRAWDKDTRHVKGAIRLHSVEADEVRDVTGATSLKDIGVI